MANKGELLFEGTEKRIYATNRTDEVILHFKDMTSAFGGIKQAVLKNKGVYNNRISAILLDRIARAGIPTHFIGLVSEREQLCRRVELIPLQMIVRNRLSGTTAAMLGVEDGTRIPNTVLELRYNSTELSDPMINAHHAVALGLASYDDIRLMEGYALRCNAVLREFLDRAGIELIDFKMEFGRLADGSIIVSDEISPDTSRMWDIRTGDRLDKDRFRHDLSDVCASYKEVMDRLVAIES